MDRLPDRSPRDEEREQEKWEDGSPRDEDQGEPAAEQVMERVRAKQVKMKERTERETRRTAREVENSRGAEDGSYRLELLSLPPLAMAPLVGRQFLLLLSWLTRGRTARQPFQCFLYRMSRAGAGDADCLVRGKPH